MLEINGVKAQSNLFATDNQFSQLKKIAVLDQYEEDDDNQSAESSIEQNQAMRLVPVVNAKADHLFIFNPNSGSLYLVKAEVDIKGHS